MELCWPQLQMHSTDFGSGVEPLVERIRRSPISWSPSSSSIGML